MNIAEIFIRRPIMTTLIMLAILLFGIMGYRLRPGPLLRERQRRIVRAVRSTRVFAIATAISLRMPWKK